MVCTLWSLCYRVDPRAENKVCVRVSLGGGGRGAIQGDRERGRERWGLRGWGGGGMFGAAIGGVGHRKQWERGRQEQGLQGVQALHRMQAAAETNAVAGIPEGAALISDAASRCLHAGL